MATVLTTDITRIIRALIKDIQKTDGRNVFQYSTVASWKLDKDYVSSTGMKVFKNGTELTSGWSYNSSTNKVTITATLVSGDDIIITFSYYERYSDTEILSFIEANLSRFVQFGYKKYFYLNSSDEVVTLNGVNPTEEEGQIIALITAIDIDPQNITIRTPDFTISASEKMTKSEQIQNVFEKWQKCYGVFGFLENK